MPYPTIYSIKSPGDIEAKREWCFAHAGSLRAGSSWWACYGDLFEFKDEQVYLLFCLTFQQAK